MSGRYLLDTNIIIGLFKGDSLIKKNLGSVQEAFVPTIALGELYYGALKSKRHVENIKVIEDFSFSFSALSCDKITAKYYGEVKKELWEKGNPQPENDVWIAALALQHDLILASRDKQFTNILQLKLENWL
ncbi:MAG: type II toxin-antitoxin system VapC family toxin [Bacillota bacterium]|nr:type II toxin-antitoxin system VapC family toxin [Bacillota bacterium]MDW7684815.1 type II toxin-antitoxin system VapC family toxin [Bacillota bacterium]